MSPAGWTLLALALLLVAVYISWTAGRLDRLHARVDAAWAGLDAALVRRAAAARAVVLHLPPRAPQTLTLESAIAAEARIGLRSQPVHGYRIPAAIGIANTL